MKKIVIAIFIFCIFSFILDSNVVIANNENLIEENQNNKEDEKSENKETKETKENKANEENLYALVDSLNEYVDTLDLRDIAYSLKNSKGLDYSNIASKGIAGIKEELKEISSFAGILICFLIFTAVLKSLELEKDSSLRKAVDLLSILIIGIMLISKYTSVLKIAKEVINTETLVVQIASPFLMTMLMLTGAITTTRLN